MKKFLQFVLFVLFFAKGFSQTFPVQIVPQAVPPHPVYISEYAKNTVLTNRLRVQLLLNDISITNQEVRLKIYIEGQGINAQGKDVVIGSTPLFLEGGVPLQLGSSDLAPYFEFQNLQGISSGIYSNPLPEGVYQFCFEVYDVFTGNRLSQKSCTSFIIFQNQPPFLNLPFNKTAITEQNPQNIIFQWTPRHINVSNIQYEFSLVEIWDDYIDPQAAFLASPPIYQEVTSQTTLIFGPSYPLLLSGRKYAWRVRAFAADGQDEIGVFNNNGYSEVFWFTYQTRCEAPLFPNVDEVSYRNAKLSWQGSLDNLDYTILYRQKNSGSQWYEITTPRQYITIDNLAPETTYEYKIKGHCDSNAFGETPLYDFTTRNQAESAYMGCNIEPDPIDIQNQELLPELFVNDVITAGDFPVTVLSLDQASTPFKGKGYVVVPWLGDTRIAVIFENIKVNSDFKLISGVIETTYDADWGNVDFVDEALEVFEGNSDQTPIEVNFDITVNEDGTINGIEINANGELQITDPATGIVITYPPGEDYVIKDNNGDSSQDVFYVDEEGNITAGGEAAEGGSLDTANTPGFASNGQIEKLTAKGIKVTFKTDGNYTYGVDKIIHSERSKLKNYYKTIQDEKGNPYDIVHKAVKNGGDDIIVGEIETDNEALIQKLVFKTAQGAKIEHTVSGKTVTLKLKGHFTFESEDVYATLQDNDDIQTTAGVFTLWHLSQEDVNVTVVPIGTAKIPDNLQNSLNAIYNPAVVQLNITEADPINIDESVWDIETTNKRLDVGESGWFANYTPEQRAIINYYEQQKGKNPNAYYIFITNIIPSRGIEGFMPLGRQHGFIFTSVTNGAEENKESITQVIAHELGHGVFGLEHPFTQLKTTQNATNWLMDYASGNTFNHIEWAKIHNPDFDLYRFQSDEGGESAVILSKLPIEFTVKVGEDNFFPFLTPNNEILFLDYEKTIRPVFYFGIDNDNYEKVIPGSLIGFERIVENDTIKYKGKFLGDGFEGYISATSKNFENETIPPNITKDFVVIGYPSPDRGEQGYIVAKHNYSGLNFYSGGITPIVRVDQINFKPNFENQQFSKGYSDALLTGQSQTSITNLYSETISGHKKGDEYLIMLKIAEWRNRYPIIFEKFTTTFDDWSLGNLVQVKNTSTYSNGGVVTSSHFYGPWNGKMGEDNQRLYNLWKSNNGKYEFYKELLIELEKFLVQQSNKNRACLENYEANVESMSITDLLTCLNLASEDEIRTKISYEGRVSVIKRLLDQFYVDGQSEKAIVKLLTHVPSGFNSDSFIDELLTNCRIQVSYEGGGRYTPQTKVEKTVCFWEVLFESVDDRRIFASGDNRKALMQALLKHYYNSKRYENDLKEYEKSLKDLDVENVESKSFVFSNDYQSIYRRLWSDLKLGATHGYSYDPNDFYSSIDTRVINENIGNATSSIQAEQNIKRGLFLSNNQYTKDFYPFDLVIFSNKSNQDLLSDFTLKDQNGMPKAFPVPAIALHYASEVGNNETTGDVVQTSFDVLTLVIPGGQVSQLSKIGRYIYYSDKVSSVTSIAGSAFAGEPNGLGDLFNKVSIATGIFSMADLAISTKKIVDIKKADVFDGSPIQIVNNTDEVAKEVLKLKNENRLNELSQEHANTISTLLEYDKKALSKYLDDGNKIRFNDALTALRAIAVSSNRIEAFTTKIGNTLPKLLQKFNDITIPKIKERFLDDFENLPLEKLKELENETDLVDLWKKWGDPEDELIKLTGKRVAEIDDLKYLKHVLGKDPPQYLNSFEDFYKKSKWQIGKVDDPKFAARCYEALLENTATAASEKLLKIYDDYASVLKIGGKYDWPVNDGFYRITKTDAPPINSHFDRFDNNQEISGSFASPVNPAVSSPTHSSRALKENFSDFSTADDDYYHHLFEVVKNDAVTFEYGTALPWFGKLGEAEQIKSNLRLADLQDAGKIKIIKTYHFTNGKWLKHVEDITKKLADPGLASAFKKDWENTAFRNLFENATDREIGGLLEAWKALDQIGVDGALRKNTDYLKNVDDYAKRSGKSPDEVLELAKNNENGIEQFLDELEDTPASGHWDKNPFQRGKDIEDDLGQNLPETFKTIDKYDNMTGEATSIKSLDLDAKTYQTPSKLRSRLNKYLNELDNFDSYQLEGVEIGDIENPINSKTLELAIPRPATGEQLNVINDLISSGTSKGINIKIVEFP